MPANREEKEREAVPVLLYEGAAAPLSFLFFLWAFFPFPRFHSQDGTFQQARRKQMLWLLICRRWSCAAGGMMLTGADKRTVRFRGKPRIAVCVPLHGKVFFGS